MVSFLSFLINLIIILTGQFYVNAPNTLNKFKASKQTMQRPLHGRYTYRVTITLSP